MSFGMMDIKGSTKGKRKEKVKQVWILIWT